MINKIDPSLSNLISSLSVTNNLIDCIVYSNNYLTSKFLLNKLSGLNKVYEFPFINAFAVKLNANQISSVANLNTVSYITASLKVQTEIAVSKNIIQLNSNSAVNNFTTVVIDTGVSPILDLCVPKNRIIKFVDFVNDKNCCYDDNGHGTFVTSILSGGGTVSNGKYSGINKNANIISIKALDANGETGVINILKAMQWVIDNKRAYNIKVVCMSFGSMVLNNNDPLIMGAEVLWNNGITVVAAAGNSGPEIATIKSPGASSKIITVGAINDFRENDSFDFNKFEVAEFSSRGPILKNYKPDIVAPGVNICAACNYNLENKHYLTMSGTSVATPIVAGVCGLLLSKNDNLKPNDIKRLLINNTIKLNEERNAEGFGLLNCKNFII